MSALPGKHRDERRGIGSGVGWGRAMINTSLGLSLLLAPAALADGYLASRVPEPTSPPTWAEPGEPIPLEGTGWTPVVAALANAEARVRRAWHNVVTAKKILTRAKTRRYPRGEPFIEVRERVVSLEAERKAAETEFVTLVEQSRRDGMPAGTLSPFMDFADEIDRDRARRAAAP